NPTTPVTTGPGGIAAVSSWTLGTTAGPNTLTATAAGSGITGNPVTFTATGTAGAAAKLAITTQPSATARSGVAFLQQPVIQLQDASGNPVAGVAVTFVPGTGSGSVTGANPATDATGIAAVGSWMLGTTAGPNTLTATAPGLTGSPLTFTANGVAGAPATLAKFSGDNLTGQVGGT